MTQRKTLSHGKASRMDDPRVSHGQRHRTEIAWLTFVAKGDLLRGADGLSKCSAVTRTVAKTEEQARVCVSEAGRTDDP